MPYKSPAPDLDIPKCNILSYLFPPDRATAKKPIWIDAANTSNSLSAAQMLLWIKRFAVGLEKIGIAEQQAVMVFTPNHLFVPMVYLASAGSKRYFTGANPTYTSNEVAYQMKNVEAAVVLVHPSLLDTAIAAAREANIPLNRLYLFSEQVCPPVGEVRDWRSMIASESEAASWQWDPLEGEAALQTIATINFSSGTTGLPKGVCITHRNLIANAAQVIQSQYSGSHYVPNNERWLAFLPLYHAYSQLITINIACKLQVPCYVMGKFVFEDYLKSIQSFKITRLHLVPPVLVMIAKRPETAKYDLSTIKHITCGAAPLSKELQAELMERYPLVISQGWGMTETTCSGFMNPGMTNLTGSIGNLLANTEACLMNDDGNEVTREGDPGEIWVRGPQTLLKYWRNEKSTQESITPDRWFKTGDVGIVKDGMWWIVDRKKELIKVNGLQVAPAELEAVLLEHPDVADSAAVGITLHDEELPRAYIVLQDGAKGKTTEQDIFDFVASKVAKHKRLTGGIQIVDEIPKLPSGKIMRKVMREWAKRDAKELEGKIKARI